MKHSLICGSILLLVPVAARAQFLADPALEPAPSLKLTPRPAQTPALDAFAGVATQLQLQARWVQIDADKLPKNLPAWNKGGAWSHVATPDELKTLELMKRTGNVSVTEQPLRALNNQTVALTYSPFKSIRVLQPPPFDSGPIDDMIIPRDKPRFETIQPYMPNLAKPESRLPEMAPMPGAGGRLDPPFIKPSPAPAPAPATEFGELLAYKFQLRPTIIGDQIALDLRSTNSAENIISLARADYGETVVFALPNIVEFLQNGQVDGIIRFQTKRTFLLVTPRVMPPAKSDSR